LGFVFALVGGLDLLLAWYPAIWNNSEWKFATVTTTLNSFPLFSLGLVLLTGSAMGRGRKWLMRTMVVVLAVVVLLLLGCALLYLPQISPALANTQDATIKIGLQRAILKTVVQLVMYPIVLAGTAWLSWKHYRSQM
jgi:cytochrome bd-type quinol oxidase subunit 2